MIPFIISCLFSDGVCMVANITQRPEADLFGVTESDGRLHVMTSNTALKFGQQYNEVSF